MHANGKENLFLFHIHISSIMLQKGKKDKETRKQSREREEGERGEESNQEET
jgi:hypothetical protein